MARAIALVSPLSLPSIEVLRPLVVYGCALALILAGPALPALGV
jgi:hypothetical protein